MHPRLIRRIVVATFVVGIAGMIVGSILERNGMAVAFGLMTAVAAFALIVVTSVAGAGAFEPPTVFDAATAADLEERIESLAASGADEAAVRDLVRLAVRLGRSAQV